ncbi:MAG: hypothetical protein AAFW70_06135 [Cyanobacteria bacterium J06635_10]
MKSVFRLVLVLMLVVGTIFSFPYHSAQALNLDLVSDVYESAKAGGKDALCRKGNAFGGTFSLRSFKGELCANSKAIAALGEYVCTNPEVAGFEGSKCDRYAKVKLDGEDPYEVLKQEVENESLDIVKKLIKLFL